MPQLLLETIDPKPLEVFAFDRDLLRDLFAYLDYVRDHSIKRMTRTNEIPRTDSVRIARLLGDPQMVSAAQETGGVLWIDFIDLLAYRLHLVHYDIKGEYRGYSSSESTFTDNYIIIDAVTIEKFLTLAPVEQEIRILDALINAKKFNNYDNYSFNEFFEAGIFGRLDQFSTRGSGTGLIPTLDFAEIRNFLLRILENCEPGQWYSVASLVAYLKTNHPFFLIPQNAPSKDRWGKPQGRYDNFYEGQDRWSSVDSIPVDAPDAFERVEGRYIERFLEHIPLILRFVDVAYDPRPYTGLHPTLGILKGFRVNARFLRLRKREKSTPKVTIQPNFDVVVESDFYPAAVISQLAAMGELVSNPNSGHDAYVGIFQLKKTAVAAVQAKQPDLNVAALLKRISGRDLPSNVEIELDEWSSHADQFTLYDGFSLLEMSEVPPNVEKYTAETISTGIRLVRQPEKVFAILESLGQVPLRFIHPGKTLLPVPSTTESLFPKESAQVAVPKAAKPVKVSRLVMINYQFPDDESFAAIQKTLAELRCPFHSDAKTHVITIQNKEQARFDQAVAQMAKDYQLEIE